MAEGKSYQAHDSSERLRRLYELALTVAGNPVEVFDQIVTIVADLFKIRAALVEKLEGDKIITLSMYLDGRILHEGVFDLAGTPCANVRDARAFCAYNRAADRFPNDLFLKENSIDFYIGVPVIGSSGEVIAIINAMSDGPLYLTENDRYFMEALASRVRLELERAEQTALAMEKARLFAELERANKRLLEIDRLKTEMIAELSTPLIPIRDRILLAPIIGTLTSDRAQKLTEALLDRTAGSGSEVIILDITGVRLIDSDAAQHLRNTVASVRVLGAHCIITGIGATIARTLVRLGITFEGIETRRTLSDGLQLAHDLHAGRRRD